jgi:hypothetical protein
MTLINIKKGLAAAIATSLLALSVSAPVNGATGTTTIGVTINEFVVLYYFDKIKFAITAADLVQHIDSAADATDSSVEDATLEDLGNLTITANAITGDADIDITDPDPENITVTIDNAWAVSSVDDGALNISVTNSGLSNGTETITTSAVGTSTSISTAGLDIQTGNIKFTMDISSAATGGEYEGDFVITVNNT